MRLLVIDGNSIANRAFYGIKLLTTNGRPLYQRHFRLSEYPALPAQRI